MALALLALASCTSTATPTGPEMARAMCDDLASGKTPLDLWRAAAEKYSPREFADRARLYTEQMCPEQLENNEALRTFLVEQGIPPDREY